MDDATLVSRAVGGDRDAFADIYDRYGGAVLDLCTAVLRDGEEAAEATLDSFLRAARELVNLRDRSRLRVWLLAVARHEATVRAERGRHGDSSASGDRLAAIPGATGDGAEDGAEDGGGDEAGDGPGAGPVGPAEAADSGAADPWQPMWDPSQSLSAQDRATLHLHLRHQLDGEELSAALGLRAATAGARAEQLRRRAEQSVGTLLLSRADGGVDAPSCPGLADVLDGWDGRFTPAVGARVDRHVRRCTDCRERRTMLLDRLRAMASLPFLPPPPWLRREVLIRMELAVSPRPLPGWAEDGFPPGIGGPVRARRPGRRRTAAAAAAIVLLVLTGGGFLLLRDDDGRSTLTASGSPATSRPTVTSMVSTTTGPAPLAVTAVPPSTSSASTSPSSTSPSATNPGLGPDSQPPVPPVAFDRDPPFISFGADLASAYTAGCPYSVIGVSADVSDQSAITWVALVVRGPEGGEVSVPMSPESSGLWRATMGEFSFAGQAVFWVEAFDSEGNQARSGDQVLDVFPCE